MQVKSMNDFQVYGRLLSNPLRTRLLLI